MMTPKLVFEFGEAEVAALNTHANGKGGFQSFIRELQGLLDQNTGKLALSDAQVGKVVRYLSYQPGGFEGRLARALRGQLHGFID